MSPQWNRASIKRLAKNSHGKPSQNYSLAETFDLSGIPRIDLVFQFYDSLSLENQERFIQLLKYAVNLSEEQSLEVRIINGYTSQPKSYNHTPMIVFAQFTPSGRAKQILGRRAYH